MASIREVVGAPSREAMPGESLVKLPDELQRLVPWQGEFMLDTIRRHGRVPAAMPLTVPAVPTGIKAGVRTTPWGVLNSAARAEVSGSLPTMEKGNIRRGPVRTPESADAGQVLVGGAL